MTLQTSGPISFANLQSEFGGSNPISLSEYYRNGGLVPNSLTTPPTGSNTYVVSWSDPINRTAQLGAIGTYMTYSGGTYEVYISGDYVTGRTNTPFFPQWVPFNPPEEGSETGVIGGVGYTNTYSRYRPGGSLGSDKYELIEFIITEEQISLETPGGSIPVNQSVPTSGAVSLSNFYGGRKT